MSGWRAFRKRGDRRSKTTSAPPQFWGRIGIYEAVSREGVLLLLAPDPVHPSQRVTTGA